MTILVLREEFSNQQMEGLHLEGLGESTEDVMGEKGKCRYCPSLQILKRGEGMEKSRVSGGKDTRGNEFGWGKRGGYGLGSGAWLNGPSKYWVRSGG